MSQNDTATKNIKSGEEKAKDASPGKRFDQMSQNSDNDQDNEIQAILEEEGVLDDEEILDPDDPDYEEKKKAVADASTKRGSITSLTNLRGVPEWKKKEVADILDLSDLDQLKGIFQFKEKYSRPLTEQEKKLEYDIQSRRCVYEVD